MHQCGWIEAWVPLFESACDWIVASELSSGRLPACTPHLLVMTAFPAGVGAIGASMQRHQSEPANLVNLASVQSVWAGRLDLGSARPVLPSARPDNARLLRAWWYVS